MSGNSPPGGKSGKLMLIAAWLIALGLLTVYFKGYEQDRANPNRDVESRITNDYIEVQLDQNRGGHYVATGSINGVAVNFLLDTGATFVAVPHHLKDKLGLKEGMPITTKTANGNSRSYLTTLASVTLGDIELRDVRAGLATGLRGDEILLGMSFLSQLELVQRGETLTIRQFR
jgi:aspartyl protease family protein